MFVSIKIIQSVIYSSPFLLSFSHESFLTPVSRVQTYETDVRKYFLLLSINDHLDNEFEHCFRNHRLLHIADQPVSENTISLMIEIDIPPLCRCPKIKVFAFLADSPWPRGDGC